MNDVPSRQAADQAGPQTNRHYPSVNRLPLLTESSALGSGRALPQAIYRRILDRIDTAILITDADLDAPGPRIVYVNAAFTQMSGYSADELIGQTPRILQGPQTAQPTLKRMRSDLAASQSFQGEIINYRKDGSAYMIEWRIDPLHDHHGRVIYWIASQHDVTERYRTEQTLRKREELYRLITEHSRDLIGLLDAQGRFRYVSPSYQRLLGYDRASLFGSAGAELIHADDQATFRRMWQATFAYGQGQAICRYRHAQGAWFWFEVQSALFDYNGEPCVALICHDITQRRWAEEAFQASEQRLQAAMRDAPLLLFVLDRLGRVTQAAGQMFQHLKIATQSLIGKSIFALYQDIDPLHEHVSHALSGRSSTSIFYFHGAPFEAWFSPIHASDGVVTGVILVAIDISKRQHLEASLFQAQKLEMVGQLAGGLAHDFNNLLTGVQVGADLILAAAPPESSMYHDAKLIQMASQRAAELTRRLLTFAGRQQDEMQLVDLRAVLREILPLIRSMLGAHITVEVQEAESLGLIRVDTTQIEQVLINLAANARDAMPDGGTLSIVTRMFTQHAGERSDGTYRQPGTYVRLIVGDTGSGMNEQVRARIFEPFFTTKSSEHGTGLGLAICYRIITQYHGAITVESAEQRGTTFIIDLPSMTPEPS